ncbi:hypothetical protein [Corynebacterium sp.]|uniref:hypothetical protein n=1 Tax=Corynebacterium sp. TaxID=1720 RepID=UPI0028A8C9A0|nr:hypothetical protein [Corynebacterium sp.]
MLAFPGVVVGVIYAFVMLAATVALRRTKFFKGNITPQAYLRASMFLTLVMCILMMTVEEPPISGAWLVLFFMGFQIIAIVTSYLAPEDHRHAAEEQ